MENDFESRFIKEVKKSSLCDRLRDDRAKLFFAFRIIK